MWWCDDAFVSFFPTLQSLNNWQRAHVNFTWVRRCWIITRNIKWPSWLTLSCFYHDVRPDAFKYDSEKLEQQKELQWYFRLGFWDGRDTASDYALTLFKSPLLLNQHLLVSIRLKIYANEGVLESTEKIYSLCKTVQWKIHYILPNILRAPDHALCPLAWHCVSILQ